MSTQKFTSDWWNEFLTDTQSMTKTAVFKDCLSEQDTAYMREHVLNCLREIAKLRTISYGYRVFVEGRQLPYNEIVNIFENSPEKDETIEQWSVRVFDDKKFGMIINTGEKFDPELSQFIAMKVQPLLEKVGFPREGINFTLFIGNYDNTPLGIHQDSPGENVIHFHLGPFGKTMYTWNNDEYEKLVGDKKINNKEVDKYIPYATAFPFEEGDLYFMPQGEYHVGKNEGLSMAITFWFYNHNKERFAKKLNSIIIDEFLQSSSDLLKPDKNPLDDTSGVEDTLNLFDMPDDMLELPLKDLMREAYKDLRYSIHSNAGYRTSPISNEQELNLNSESIIQILRPYKILYKESLNKDKLHLFMRGVKLEVNNFSEIKNFVDKINNESPIKFFDLMQVMEIESADEIAEFLVEQLYENRCIEVK